MILARCNGVNFQATVSLHHIQHHDRCVVLCRLGLFYTHLVVTTVPVIKWKIVHFLAPLTKQDACAGALGDMYSFDMKSMKWKRLDETDEIPSPRYGMGMASQGNKLFVFGGHNDTGASLLMGRFAFFI